MLCLFGADKAVCSKVLCYVFGPVSSAGSMGRVRGCLCQVLFKKLRLCAGRREGEMRVLNDQQVGVLSAGMRKALYLVDYAFIKNDCELNVTKIQQAFDLGPSGPCGEESFDCQLSPGGSFEIMTDIQLFLGSRFEVSIKGGFIHVEKCGKKKKGVKLW